MLQVGKTGSNGGNGKVGFCPGFASGKPVQQTVDIHFDPTPYRYDSGYGQRKGDHLENHLVTLFDVWR